MLPGLNAAAVGLIIAAVFQLMFSVRDNSPTPLASTAIGAPQILPYQSQMHFFHPSAGVDCVNLQRYNHVIAVCVGFAGVIGFCLVDFLDVAAPIAIIVGGLLGMTAWALKAP